MNSIKIIKNSNEKLKIDIENSNKRLEAGNLQLLSEINNKESDNEANKKIGYF